MEARAYLQEVEVGADGLRVVTKLVEGEPPEYVQSFAREVAQAENTVALLVQIESGQIVFAQHPTAAKDMNALLAEALKHVPKGKGGGSRAIPHADALADPSSALQRFLTIATPALRTKL